MKPARSTALVAAALALGLSGIAHADDGLPPPPRPTSAPAAPDSIASLESKTQVLAKEIKSDEKELHTLEHRYSIVDELEHGAGYFFDLGSLEHGIKGEESKVQKKIVRLESEEAAITSQVLAAKEAAAQAAAAAAAPHRAAEEKAALDGHVDHAIDLAANAWRADGIVNQNTGDHSWDMYCLALASTAWSTSLGYQVPDLTGGSAWESAQKWMRDGLMQPWTDGTVPPRGALVYWPAEGHGGFGHVAISNGDGTVVSNYTRAVVATGINPHANISDFGPPIGWVDPKDVH